MQSFNIFMYLQHIRMFFHVPGAYIYNYFYFVPATEVTTQLMNCTSSYTMHMPKWTAHSIPECTCTHRDFISYQQMHVRPQWQWLSCQSSWHLCWRCHCLPAQSVQWCMRWCIRDCRGAELSWEVVSCAAPLSCLSPSCEAGLLPSSMQGEGTVSKQVQKWKGYQEGRWKRRERRCRLTQPTSPLRWATSHKRASTSMCQVEVFDMYSVWSRIIASYVVLSELVYT